jgi:hypothetical protein
MRYTTRAVQEPGTHTVDGESVSITRTRHVRVPKLPLDTDQAVRRAVAFLVVLLTVAAVAWSTWSISAVLGGTPVAIVVSVVFDLSWACCLALDYLARHQPAKQALPRRLGWVLLVVTMGSIALHGLMLHSVPMAVVGALVSATAKLLWAGVVKTSAPTMSDDDRAWVAAQLSRAGAQTVVAQVRRQVARAESRAALELLAMEAERAELGVALGVPLADLSGAPALGSATADRRQAQVPVAAGTGRDAAAVEWDQPVTEGLLSVVRGESSDGTDRDQDDRVPQADGAPEGSARHLQPVRGTTTQEIRNLIGQGVTDPGTIRSLLQDSGLKAPDQSYIRRLVREARAAATASEGSGGYL